MAWVIKNAEGKFAAQELTATDCKLWWTTSQGIAMCFADELQAMGFANKYVVGGSVVECTFKI